MIHSFRQSNPERGRSRLRLRSVGHTPSKRLHALFASALLTLSVFAPSPLRAVEADPQPAAYSLSGEPLFPTPLSEDARVRLESELASARADYEADPDESNTIWYGRRLAYLLRLEEAISVFSDGLARFPDSYRLLRHRGHRHISMRRFEAAVADLERARTLMPREGIEVEPDGRPNALGIPLSNTQFNILYHLALAHYLKGNFAQAAETWRACLAYSVNPDLLVATTDWLYMSLRRQGLEAEAEAVLAPITPDLSVIENDAYLKRLRMYRGETDVAALMDTDAEDRSLALATQGYGVANWYLFRGDEARARALWEDIRATGAWAAFGYIAAEADRVRLGE
jgi:tetratricopeptide (TPR) repeat protein